MSNLESYDISIMTYDIASIDQALITYSNTPLCVSYYQALTPHHQQPALYYQQGYAYPCIPDVPHHNTTALT